MLSFSGESALMMMPAAAAVTAGKGSVRCSLTGMVAIAALVVISAIIIAVMGVPAYFGTSFYRADGTSIII